MNEMYTDRADHDDERSGVFGSAPMERALQLIARWESLRPNVSQRPAEGHALVREIAATMELLMAQLVAGQVAPAGLGRSDELLDATYVLERLEWCVLHRVPYIERPRTPQVG